MDTGIKKQTNKTWINNNDQTNSYEKKWNENWNYAKMASLHLALIRQ